MPSGSTDVMQMRSTPARIAPASLVPCRDKSRSRVARYGWSGPQPEQHRAFEHKPIADAGHAETVEKSLGHVRVEQRLVVIAGSLRAIEQTREHRRRHVPRSSRRHEMAS